jgi:hypothetical protein
MPSPGAGAFSLPLSTGEHLPQEISGGGCVQNLTQGPSREVPAQAFGAP